MLQTDFPKLKTCQIYESNSAGQIFRNTLNQMRRCRAQQKKSGILTRSIHKYPEQLETVPVFFGPRL